MAAAFSCMLPAAAQERQFAFLVVRTTKSADTYYIWSADCKNLNLGAASQKSVNCELTRNECKPDKPGACKLIDFRSTDYPPLPLVFGIAETNPICGWVWDPYRRTYVYKQC
jgi:hypothetical protein